MRPYYLINIAIERTMRTRWEDTVTQEKWMVMIDSVRTLCTIAIHFDTDFAFLHSLANMIIATFIEEKRRCSQHKHLPFEPTKERANQRWFTRTILYNPRWFSFFCPKSRFCRFFFVFRQHQNLYAKSSFRVLCWSWGSLSSFVVFFILLIIVFQQQRQRRKKYTRNNRTTGNTWCLRLVDRRIVCMFVARRCHCGN